MPPPKAGDQILNCETTIRQLTNGPWQVAKNGITVDPNDKVIYFEGESLNLFNRPRKHVFRLLRVKIFDTPNFRKFSTFPKNRKLTDPVGLRAARDRTGKHDFKLRIQAQKTPQLKTICIVSTMTAGVTNQSVG